MAGDGTVVAQLAAAFEHAVWGAATLKEAAAAVANVAGAAGVELAARPLVICELYRDCGPAAASVRCILPRGGVGEAIPCCSILLSITLTGCALLRILGGTASSVRGWGDTSLRRIQFDTASTAPTSVHPCGTYGNARQRGNSGSNRH